MRLRTTRSLATALACAAVAAAGSGCGGSDGARTGGKDGAVREIRAAFAKSVSSSDAEARCVETVTKRFVAAVYDNVAACRKAHRAPPEASTTPSHVTLSHVDVNGDSAHVVATLHGGNSDGLSGGVSLAIEDGAWKVDELGVDYLRALLEKGLTADLDGVPGRAARAEVLGCTRDWLHGLSDGEVRKAAYDITAERYERPQRSLATMLSACLARVRSSSGPGGSVSALRKQFEDNMAQFLTSIGRSRAQADCVVGKLRTTLSEQQIIEEVARRAARAGQRDDDALDSDAQRAILDTIRECG
jgi:hypothetical protein